MKKTIFYLVSLGTLLTDSFLLVNEMINWTIFVVILLGGLFTAFLIYRIDDINFIKTKWFELRALKKEIYAKVEELNKLEKKVVIAETQVKNTKTEIQQLSRGLIRLISFSTLLAGNPNISKKLRDNFTAELRVLTNMSFDDEKEAKAFGAKLLDDIDKI